VSSETKGEHMRARAGT